MEIYSAKIVGKEEKIEMEVYTATKLLVELDILRDAACTKDLAYDFLRLEYTSRAFEA